MEEDQFVCSFNLQWSEWPGLPGQRQEPQVPSESPTWQAGTQALELPLLPSEVSKQEGRLEAEHLGLKSALCYGKQAFLVVTSHTVKTTA